MLKSLAERDRDAIWHPYTQMKLAPDPLAITHAKGIYLHDAAGTSYIDAISSWWVNLHGHAHPYLAQKVYEQALRLEHVIFAGFTHQPAIELAERLLEILPQGMKKIFYSDNGSTAVEVALKMSIQYWKNKGLHLQRKKILALTNSYHGDTFGAMSVSERGPFTMAFNEYLFEVEFIDAEKPAFAGNWDEIACFIYEPLVQGAGGMKMYPAETLNALLVKCRQHQVLCIADEVMTGFGRTGQLFASDHLRINPDIICLSKGLTGGMMALGVTACTAEVYDAFLSDDRTKTFFHGHSYTANPLACAAGNASLDLLLEKECMDNIRRIVQQHQNFAQQNPQLNVRVSGTILAFEIPVEQGGYLNNIGATVHKKALQQGVLLRPLGNTVYIMPPYCITEDELEKVYEVMCKCADMQMCK
ncbi:MAG TPA: adenosylmethionine--8-amino-7-oxononanoate transaminase [Chitinophagaceae bacterium]|nr:adenosylmethionine--8-amino-7-oxononanoate transaminase [Chitinophagaceae bacterium]